MSNIYDTAPASELVAVTKSDTTTYSPPLRGVWVGTGGDIAIRTASMAAAVTIANVPDGTLLPVKAIQVMSTNTDASDIVGLR